MVGFPVSLKTTVLEPRASKTCQASKMIFPPQKTMLDDFYFNVDQKFSIT